MANPIEQGCCFTIGFLACSINQGYFSESFGTILFLALQRRKVFSRCMVENFTIQILFMVRLKAKSPDFAIDRVG
jgi:hypothetical protein